MSKNKRLKIIIACCVFVLAGGYLVYQSVQSSWTYYYGVDEFIGSEIYDKAIAEQYRVRLAGMVMDSGLSRNINEMQLKFQLGGKSDFLKVVYNGIVPKNFEAGKEVLVEGVAAADRIFNADKILTRCESKYQKKLQEKL